MKAIYLIFLLLPGFAMATGKTAPPPVVPQETSSEANAAAAATATADANAAATATLTTDIVNDASNEGVQQEVSFSSPRQVASAIAPGVFSANPCAIGGSAALGLKQVNIGGGREKIDPDCAKLETGRFLGALGEREFAIEMACSTTSAVEVLGDRCKPTTTRIELLQQEIERQKAELEHQKQLCNDAKNDIFREACKTADK